MTKKTAITAAPIMPVIAERFSTRSYDSDYEMTQHEWLAVLEAGRWAASANNAQPWRFSIAKRGTEMHAAVAAATSGFNQAWSPKASAYIVVSVVKTNADGTPHKTAHFDGGLAVAQMMLQAVDLGLSVHPMTGIDFPGVAAAVDLPEELEVLVLLAIGKPGAPDLLEGAAYEREIAPRVRHDLDDIVLTGKP